MSGVQPRPPYDPSLLIQGGTLRMAGVEPSGDPAWQRVRHGIWCPASHWAALGADEQHQAFVHGTALCDDAESEALFSHSSAAALWGLPRIEPWPEMAHVLTPTSARSSGLIRRHHGPCDSGAEIQGARVTTAARTVVDVARTSSFATGLAAADHALRHRLCTRDELRGELDRLAPRTRGRRVAARVVALADPFSMSAGESLSRARMFELGLPRPQLQVAVHDHRGLIGYADFAWGRVYGEFDGRQKYRVPQGASPRDAEEVLWREKRREDRLRRRGEVARWTWDMAISGWPLRDVLGEVGVRPLARSDWLAQACEELGWPQTA